VQLSLFDRFGSEEPAPARPRAWRSSAARPDGDARGDATRSELPAGSRSVPGRSSSGAGRIVELSSEPSAAGLDDAIVFVRHRRARRYVLRVLADGRVSVTLPRWGTRREALEFVSANRAWIASERRRRLAALPSPPGPLRPFVERWWRAKAARELPARLRALADAHGIPVPRISVRDQRSRWGSCSSRGTITLNWRLIRVPDYVCEYVLVHELMHRRELNHSRRFWRLVAACCPCHLEARRWLRTEGRRLWSDGL
jgi:predicted metal-dependent hydrolase